MTAPEDKNQQAPSSNEARSGQKPSADAPEQGQREREAERKQGEPADLGQAAEESKRDTNA
jgi:hypothetical protein